MEVDYQVISGYLITINFLDKPCGYNLFGPKATLAWRVAHGAVGNRATGIHRDVNGNISEQLIRSFARVIKNLSDSSNSYLLASGERRGLKDVFVAQSRPFRLDRSISIRFFRHLISSSSQLRVCVNDVSSFCPATYRIDVDALNWQESVVDLNPSDLPKELKNKPTTVSVLSVKIRYQ